MGFFFSLEGIALDCAMPSRERQVARASDVFVGKILRKHERYFLVDVKNTQKGEARGRVKVQFSVWGVMGSSLSERVLFAVQRTSDPKVFQLQSCDGIFDVN